MTVHYSSPDSRRHAGTFWRRWGGVIIGLLICAVIGAFLWYLLSGTASTKREVAPTSMLMLPPPPPPPPEPEKLPEPEPEKVKPEVTEVDPKPVEQPTEKPAEDNAPNPSKDMGDPVTIAGDAQAGTDAFGIQAGRGGGTTGTGGGLGNGSYSRYVLSVLERAFARDARTRNLVFDDIRLDLWLAADGKATRVEIVRSSGNPKIDEDILRMLREIDHVDERPPQTMRFPMRVTMKGRRP